MTHDERADRARVLLKDEVLNAAFADIRERLIAQIEAAPISDVETQHEIALMLQLVKRVRVQLEQYLQDALVSEHKAKHDRFIDRMRQRIGR